MADASRGAETELVPAPLAGSAARRRAARSADPGGVLERVGSAAAAARERATATWPAPDVSEILNEYERHLQTRWPCATASSNGQPEIDRAEKRREIWVRWQLRFGVAHGIGQVAGKFGVAFASIALGIELLR